MAAPATTALNTLTDTQSKAIETIVKVQSPIVDAVRKAVDFLDTSVPDLPTRDLGEKLPSMKQFVDNQYAFASSLLEVNHRFVLDLLDATKPVTEKVVAQKSATGVHKVTKAPARKRPAAEAA